MTTEDVEDQIVEDPPEVIERIGIEDVKEAAVETGARLREAGLATFVDPILEGLGDLTRKVFTGLGKVLDELDDKKRK